VLGGDDGLQRGDAVADPDVTDESGTGERGDAVPRHTVPGPSPSWRHVPERRRDDLVGLGDRPVRVSSTAELARIRR
jgi:hypothetical protein